MGSKDRRIWWAFGLVVVALFPVGMAIAVVYSFEPGKAAPASASIAPRIVATWPAGLMETHVAFDQPVDPAVATGAVGRSIRFGPATPSAPGEGRPGGDGGSIRIAAARLIDEGRTLVLATDPHPTETTYELKLDAIKAPGDPGEGRSQVVQYTLKGVEVAWTAEGSDDPAWSGWWPEVNPATVRVALAGSSEHDRLWPLLERSGKVTLRTFVTLPPAKVEVVVTGTTPFEVTFGAESATSDASLTAKFAAETTEEPDELTATITTIAGGPAPTMNWTMAAIETKDSTPRVLPSAALGLAWAPSPLPKAAPTVLPPSLASGGDPKRGALVFVSERAKCANCHQVRGVGGQVGPDLSNLSRASRAWILQNINEPSSSIHPDFASYTVALKDGRISMGIVRAEGGDTLRVGDIDAKFTTFPRAEVEEIRPSRSSIMPVGLLGALGEDQTRDLLAFLTSEEPAVPTTVQPGSAAASAP